MNKYFLKLSQLIDDTLFRFRMIGLILKMKDLKHQNGADPIPAVGQIRFGDMRRLLPFGNDYGYERGGPVDRYYIENFLDKNSSSIKGRALEIKNDSYIKQFGGNRIIERDILDIDAANPLATVIADLSKADHLPSDTYDCIILTQTLQFIYEPRSALKHMHRILKPGGTLLLTVPGITRFKYTEHGYNWYWNFTEASVKNLLKEFFIGEKIKTEFHGNVLVSSAFLYCIGSVELTKEEYDFHDPDFQFIITAKAVK